MHATDDMNSRIYVVGLTGGIASGKSLVADLFAKLDVPIVDSDVLARAMVQRGSPGLAAIVAAFGEQVLDRRRSLDRSMMRDLIFSDPKKKKLLEEILHPLIREEARNRLRKLTAAFAIYVIPLLIEKNLQDQVDRVLLVDTSEKLQLERLMKRDNCNEKQARQILRNQATRQERLEAADDIISNDSDIAAVSEQVLVLYEKYRIIGRSRNR